MTGCGTQCFGLVDRVMISQILMIFDVFFKLILCLCDESCSDLTLCAGYLKRKTPSEGQKRAGHKGGDTAVKGKPIIICETLEKWL